MERAHALVSALEESVRQQWVAASNEQKLLTAGTTTLIGALSAWALYKWYKLHCTYPPGPPGMFFSGGGLISEKIVSFRQKYGDVSSARVLNTLIVQLNTTAAIREAFQYQGDIFGGRVRNSLRDGNLPTAGVAFTEGIMWREHRRFVLASLRDLGFGKNVMERVIQEETLSSLRYFEELKGEPIDPASTFGRTVANVIASLVTGEPFKDDEEFRTFASLTRIIVTDKPAWSLSIVLWRILIWLPGDYFNLKKHFGTYRWVLNAIEAKIDKKRQNYKEGTPETLIDAYLQEVQRLKETNTKLDIFTDAQLTHDIMHLFLAGIDTTQTTLSWASFLMASYPEIQAKVQANIDDSLGDRFVKMSDRTLLRYTDAVLHEIQRFSAIAPVGMPHRVTQDTTLRGYYVPRGSIVVANLYGVHRDPSIWPHPNSFNPENFLDAQGNFRNLESLVPFSLGKRSCLGESLAKQELFILFVSMLQRFTIKPEPGKPMPSIHAKFNGALRQPPPYNFVFVKRK